MGSILCEHCTAACCRYIALPLDKPRSARDYDDLRWYLMHQGVSVFVEEGDWYIQFQTRCKNLRLDNLCGVYETRPAICAEYEPGDCDYSGGSYGYDHLFTHPEQVAEFYRQKTGKRLSSEVLRKPGVPGFRRRKKTAKAHA
jgi:Fe-S-cluster containining protein